MSRNNNTGPDNSPLASARDRLQSSARDLIRNIESAMGSNKDRSSPETALEQAFRNLFTSCTNPTTNSADDEEEAAQVTPIPSQRSASSLSTRSSPAQQSRGGGNGTFRRLSSKLSSGRTAPPVSRRQSSPTIPTPSPHVTGEHVYAQLYLDEEEQVVQQHHFKPSVGHSPQLLGISPNPAQKRVVSTRPFPKSSPTSTPVRAISPTDGISVPNDAFDDGISAISAHTLEAMASSKRLVSHIPRSPRVSPTNNIKFTRSITPSTRTTQSSRSPDRSFEQWRNQEHQFWEAEVAVDQKTIRKKKTSRSRSWKSHPHETLPYEASDFQFDKDAETAEI